MSGTILGTTVWYIYLDIQKEHMPEARKDEILSYLMVWYLGSVLYIYLDLY